MVNIISTEKNTKYINRFTVSWQGLCPNHDVITQQKMNILGLTQNNSKRLRGPNTERTLPKPPLHPSVLSLSKQSYWGQILFYVTLIPQIQVMGPSVTHPWIWHSIQHQPDERSEKKTQSTARTGFLKSNYTDLNNPKERPPKSAMKPFNNLNIQFFQPLSETYIQAFKKHATLY